MSACARQGCSGAIDEDGFCDTCGLAAASVAEVAADDGPGTAAWTPPTAAATGTVSAATGWSADATPSEATSSDATPSGTGPSGSRRSSGRSSSRGLLGAGLVEVPRVPYRDPASAVLTNPEVPEDRRFCSNCGGKAGRGRDGKPGRVEGFCTKCGHHFSFTPKLKTGDMVHGQYEVLGCLAHGGLGWIYLALDHAVADRWVVLKGLLDTGDADAMAAAVAERRFLAEVEHPNIVKIHNFVEHHDEDAGTVGYIVMEYVGGQSIKEMLKELRRTESPSACLPLPRAIAYALEMLPALGYLHGMGLVFCDFKPDNVIQTEELLKLIDLGAVRRVDDRHSAVFGTIGYQAPEIGRQGPSPASDLYTVGRSLAVMSFPFDFQHVYREELPSVADVPLLAEHESFHRLLLRATAATPAARFTSAEEMREQLTGVLREVLAAGDGQPRPGASSEFTPERRSVGVPAGQGGARLDLPSLVTALPVPRVDEADPAAAFLATVTADDPAELIEELRSAPQLTQDVRLRIVRARIELGELDAATSELDQLAKAAQGNPRVWTVAWHRGLAALAADQPGRARPAFDTVYSAVPGEAAPKLALALCAEAEPDWSAACRYYRTVWRTDRSYVSAAFGLARALAAEGRRGEAVDVLNSVPDTSSHYVAAQLAAIRERIAGPPERLTGEDLVTAGHQLAALDVDELRRTQVTGDVLHAAFEWVASGRSANGTVLGCALAEQDLRTGLERCYRELAKYARDTFERIALVDLANRIRPRTWL